MNLRDESPPDLNGLSIWAPELAKTFVNLSSDIALVLDDDGVIQQVVQGSSATLAAAHQWVGRRWIDTVTGETRNKVTQLLQEVTSTGLARKREINHPVGEGGNLAVAYTAIRLGCERAVVGRGPRPGGDLGHSAAFFGGAAGDGAQLLASAPGGVALSGTVSGGH